MRKMIAAAVLAVTAAGAGAAGYALHTPRPAACTLPGGGRIASGDAARTAAGHVLGCADGQLYRLS